MTRSFTAVLNEFGKAHGALKFARSYGHHDWMDRVLFQRDHWLEYP